LKTDNYFKVKKATEYNLRGVKENKKQVNKK